MPRQPLPFRRKIRANSRKTTRTTLVANKPLAQKQRSLTRSQLARAIEAAKLEIKDLQNERRLVTDSEMESDLFGAQEWVEEQLRDLKKLEKIKGKRVRLLQNQKIDATELLSRQGSWGGESGTSIGIRVKQQCIETKSFLNTISLLGLYITLVEVEYALFVPKSVLI